MTNMKPTTEHRQDINPPGPLKLSQQTSWPEDVSITEDNNSPMLKKNHVSSHEQTCVTVVKESKTHTPEKLSGEARAIMNKSEAKPVIHRQKTSE